MKIITAFTIICTILSCSKKKKTTDNLQEIIGKEIILPANYKILSIGNDTIFTIDNSKPKILAFYNNQGCSLCRLRELSLWKNFIHEMDVMSKAEDTKIQFLFILSTNNDTSEIKVALSQNKFFLPVLCDTDRVFEKNNILPRNEMLHCFLLDRHNKVALIGTPLYNEKMWNRYKQEIAKINSSLSD